MSRLIEIPLPKGCRLFLTAEEYERGIRRGKAIVRSRKAEREQKNERGRGNR